MIGHVELKGLVLYLPNFALGHDPELVVFTSHSHILLSPRPPKVRLILVPSCLLNGLSQCVRNWKPRPVGGFEAFFRGTPKMGLKRKIMN